MIVEPFAGSGTCTVHYLGGISGIKKAIIADSDPTIRAVWTLYKNKDLRTKAVAYLRQMQANLTDNPKETWELIQSAFDYQLRKRGNSNPELDAAISLIYRAVAYGYIARTGKSSDKLNVSPGPEQLATINKKHWRDFPHLPPGCEIDIYTHWRLAIKSIPPSAKACVLIDPPYYSPLGMEPCYIGHKPKNLSTLADFHQSVSMAFAHPGVFRVIAKNYCGQTTRNGGVRFWSDVTPTYPEGWFMQKVVTGELKKLANRRAKKTEKETEKEQKFNPRNVEGFWYFEKNPFELPTQMSLFA